MFSRRLIVGCGAETREFQRENPAEYVPAGDVYFAAEAESIEEEREEASQGWAENGQ